MKTIFALIFAWLLVSPVAHAQGFTDPRGVFEAAAAPGQFSVVAEKDGNVALWRK